MLNSDEVPTYRQLAFYRLLLWRVLSSGKALPDTGPARGWQAEFCWRWRMPPSAIAPIGGEAAQHPLLTAPAGWSNCSLSRQQIMLFSVPYRSAQPFQAFSRTVDQRAPWAWTELAFQLRVSPILRRAATSSEKHESPAAKIGRGHNLKHDCLD